jgi:3-phenylpropionate/trans-cinnamate dioxygenase ferredoxin reductase subunit
VPDTYAAGDVANFYDSLFDRRRRIEHWSNANYQATGSVAYSRGGDGGYDTVSTFFSEIFGLTLKVFGDLSGHSELVVRGSLSDRNLLGFYLKEGRLVASLAVGQEKQIEEELQLLIKQRVVLDSNLLIDPSTDISSLLQPAANER